MAYQFGKKIKIETRHLLVRSLLPQDVNENYLSFRNSPEWQQATGRYGNTVTVQEAIKFITSVNHKTLFHFGIFSQESRKLIGICNLSRDPRQKVSTTYILIGNPGYCRKGLAGELLKFLIDFRFRSMDIEKIEEIIRGKNAAGIRLCEKLGYKKEGVLLKHEPGLDGKRIDFTLFGITREEWSLKTKESAETS